MDATMVQNVVTYDTIIDFDNPEMKLFPGMTAYVTIPVQSVQDVVKLPNGALRYSPDLPQPQVLALLQQHGISMGKGRPHGQGAASAGKAPADAKTSSGTAAGKNDENLDPGTDLGLVWKLGPEKSLVPVQVRTGVTDHTFTQLVQVVKGDLSPGDELVIGASAAPLRAAGAAPGMGISGRPRGR
jgi:HlyD family secretion protein